MSRAFRRAHPGRCVKIRMPLDIAAESIHEIRILPVLGGIAFKMQITYEIVAEPADVDEDRYLSIDIGTDSLAGCVTSDGASFLVDGRRLKSLNRLYNRQIARLGAIKDMQGIKGFTKRMNRITDRRNRQVADYMHKAVRIIVNHCIRNGIGTICIGHNIGQKFGISTGHQNNQNFVQIPFGLLRSDLKNLCQKYGIRYIETEESYTSKASFLDGDDIPVYGQNNVHPSFSGRRIRRGLYRTADGTLVNADINGACNILVKALNRTGSGNLPDSLRKGLSRGLLAGPLRIRVA